MGKVFSLLLTLTATQCKHLPLRSMSAITRAGFMRGHITWNLCRKILWTLSNGIRYIAEYEFIPEYGFICPYELKCPYIWIHTSIWIQMSVESLQLRTSTHRSKYHEFIGIWSQTDSLRHETWDMRHRKILWTLSNGIRYIAEYEFIPEYGFICPYELKCPYIWIHTSIWIQMSVESLQLRTSTHRSKYHEFIGIWSQTDSLRHETWDMRHKQSLSKSFATFRDQNFI